MGWIRERILSEYKKHEHLDWAKIAEEKIILTMTEKENEQLEIILEQFQNCLAISDLSGLQDLYNDLSKQIKATRREYY